MKIKIPRLVSARLACTSVNTANTYGDVDSSVDGSAKVYRAVDSRSGDESR